MYYVLTVLLGVFIGMFLNICIFSVESDEGVKIHFFKKGNFLKILLVEVCSVAVCLLLFYRYGFTFEFIPAAFIMSVLIVVLFIDIDLGIIPDGLVLTGFIAGIFLMVYNLFYPVNIYGNRLWYTPLLGMITGAGILFVVAIAGFLVYKDDSAMGMGDVKIFIPVGMFLGWKLTVEALVFAVFLGGIAGLVLLATGIKKRKDGIPFGPFITAGTLISLVWGWKIINWYTAGFLN